MRFAPRSQTCSKSTKSGLHRTSTNPTDSEVNDHVSLQ